MFMENKMCVVHDVLVFSKFSVSIYFFLLLLNKFRQIPNRRCI